MSRTSEPSVKIAKMTTDPYRAFLSRALDAYIAAGGRRDLFNPQTKFWLDDEAMIQLAIGRKHIARLGGWCYFEAGGWRQAIGAGS